MYESGRRLTTGIAGACARHTPVRAHVGTYSDVLGRHISNCNVTKNGKERRQILTDLLQLIQDERVLRAVMDQLDSDGPKAAGPNGLKLCDLTHASKWQLARALSGQLIAGTYRRGPTKKVDIEKPHKPGQFRTLEIPNLEDQIVQKVIEQVLNPLLDPRFDDRSYGFRPGRGREHALATALHIADAGQRVWVTEDLKNAFTSVPHGRLIDALRSQGIPRDVLELIAECIRNDTHRGISQGGCLSPLLLNAYLDKHLDRAWRRQRTETKLLRYADDICICCSCQVEANEAYDRLLQIVLPTGMTLRGNRETAIRDLRDEGVSAELLGYIVSRTNGQNVVSISERAWDSLSSNLLEAHKKPMSAVRAVESMASFVDQAGPGLRTANIEQLLERMTRIAATQDFAEVLTSSEVHAIRERALQRFELILAETATRPEHTQERVAG